MLSQPVTGELKCALSLCPKTTLGSLMSVWFPLDFTQSAFPFDNFSLYPFTVVTRGHGSDYMLSPRSAPSETESGGGLRTP